MFHSNRSPVFVVALAAAVLALPAAVTAQYRDVTLTDLSESGEALRFGRARGPLPTITVEVRGSTTADYLEFEVRGVAAGQPVLFRVLNPFPSLAPTYTEGGFVWNQVQVVSGAPAGQLQFAVASVRSHFVVRLAEPIEPDAPFYTYTRFTQYMAQIQNEPLAQVTQLGTSRQGRPIYRILIDAPSTLEKKTVLMAVRQHGNEDGSSYVLEGVLDLLLSRDGLTAPSDLLEKVRWIVYPLCNPDGAVANQRQNANGVDLNRNWRRSGCSPSQEPEIFLIQCDLENLQARWPIQLGGDHHGWGNSNHGGFRYARGASVSFVSVPEYQEAKKDTNVITKHDPSQFAWQENGGTTGMLRAEMFRRFGFLLHTPEYNDNLSSAQQFHVKGQGWARAMYDTCYAPEFTDAVGDPLAPIKLPGQCWVTVDDFDENQSTSTRETVRVVVRGRNTGDTETFVLTETGRNTGVFRSAAIQVVAGNANSGNGQMEVTYASRLICRYVDDDYPRDASTAFLPVGLERDQ